MKSTIQYIGVVFLVAMVSSCSSQSKEVKQNKELEKLAKEVMEVHDRSMPHMEELMKLKKRLIALHDSYIYGDGIKDEKDTLIRQETMQAAMELEMADDQMMHWMHTYKAPEDFLPFEEKKAYYINAKKSIEEVEILMNESMNKAKILIAKYPPQ